MGQESLIFFIEKTLRSRKKEQNIEPSLYSYFPCKVEMEGIQEKWQMY